MIALRWHLGFTHTKTHTDTDTNTHTHNNTGTQAHTHTHAKYISRNTQTLKRTGTVS